MGKENHGGIRAGAGRKKLTYKTIRITIPEPLEKTIKNILKSWRLIQK
jgi:hypothetical protein